MKKIILLSILCLLGALFVEAQTKDQIVIKKKQFFMNDKKLSNKELKSTLMNYPESAPLMKKANTNMIVGQATMIVGLGVCLYGVIYNATHKESESGNLPGLVSREETMKRITPVLIGGGIVFVGVPFVLIGQKQMKQSISIYNSKHSTGYNVKVGLGYSQDGLSLSCRF